jgi:hypothetical protein
MRTHYIITMPDGGEAGVIIVKAAHEESWTEFRGLPYSQWGDEELTWFAFIHDLLPGPQCSVLHAQVPLDIHATHPVWPVLHDVMQAIK